MQDFRYIPILQKPYCCAIACFLSILYRRTGRLYNQEELAIYFGVRIHKSSKGAFENPMKYLTSINYDEGVKTLDLAAQIQKFFQEEGIQLTIQSYPYHKILDLEGFIIDNLRDDNDIWCEYTYGEISGSKTGSNLHIHDGVIESYNLEDKSITMIDPEPSRKNRFKLSLEDIQMRISGEYSRETGFLIISK